MMMTVIAGNDMTPEKKQKLIEFAKENNVTVSYSNGGMNIECPSLKIANKVSKKIRELKKQ